MERGGVVKTRNDILPVSQNDSLLNVGAVEPVLVVVSGQNDPRITIDHAVNGEATERRAFQA